MYKNNKVVKFLPDFFENCSKIAKKLTAGVQEKTKLM
jgi:hypothetical protein